PQGRQSVDAGPGGHRDQSESGSDHDDRRGHAEDALDDGHDGDERDKSQARGDEPLRRRLGRRYLADDLGHGAALLSRSVISILSSTTSESDVGPDISVVLKNLLPDT